MILALLESLAAKLGFDRPEAPMIEIVFALGLSFLLCLAVTAVYRWTCRSGQFSQDYAHLLLILGTTVTVVVMVVHIDGKNAQATAFGIFAAFSIIRFRAVVEQTRDIGFLFLAMAAGLGVGARAYVLAMTTTLIICAIILTFSRANLFAVRSASHRLRLRVTNDVNYDTAFSACFANFLHEHELVSVESIQAGMMTELRYNVHLKDPDAVGQFVAELQILNGNNRVLLTRATPSRVMAD